MLNICNRRIVIAKPYAKLNYLSYLHKWTNEIVSHKEVEFNFRELLAFIVYYVHL